LKDQRPKPKDQRPKPDTGHRKGVDARPPPKTGDQDRRPDAEGQPKTETLHQRPGRSTKGQDRRPDTGHRTPGHRRLATCGRLATDENPSAFCQPTKHQDLRPKACDADERPRRATGHRDCPPDTAARPATATGDRRPRALTVDRNGRPKTSSLSTGHRRPDTRHRGVWCGPSPHYLATLPPNLLVGERG
jgi:hypothetical protein